MLEIEIGPRQVQCPETWNECTTPQLFAGLAIVFSSETSIEAKKLALLQALLNVTDEERYAMTADCRPTPRTKLGKPPTKSAIDRSFVLGHRYAEQFWLQLANTLSELAFAKTEDEETGAPLYTVRYERTVQPLPSLQLPIPYTDVLYAPPGDGLEGLTLHEFVASHHHFTQFYAADTHEEQNQHIASLIDVLWRPNNETGARVSSTDYSAKGAAVSDTSVPPPTVQAIIACMEPDMLRAVWFWYASSYEVLAKAFPAVFPKRDPTIVRKKRRTNDYGPVSMIYEMATDVSMVGTVAAQPLYEALAYASYKLDAALDAETTPT